MERSGITPEQPRWIYSLKAFEQVIGDIRALYLSQLEALHLTLARQATGTSGD